MGLGFRLKGGFGFRVLMALGFSFGASFVRFKVFLKPNVQPQSSKPYNLDPDTLVKFSKTTENPGKAILSPNS